MSKAQGEKPEGGEDKLTGPGEKLDRTDKCEKAEGSASAEESKISASGGGDLTIYLFGRTGREKEEWFRRFLIASRTKSDGRSGSLPGICKSGESLTELNNKYSIWVSLSCSLSPQSHTLFPQTHIALQLEYPFSRVCNCTAIRSVHKPRLRDCQSPQLSEQMSVNGSAGLHARGGSIS